MAKEIRLPDIGDFKDVPIIEILVAPGQTVRKDETLLTLESDKASMDVPAPEDGVIGEIRVKVGDKVTQGDVLATYSGGEGAKPAAEAPTPKAASAAGAQGGGAEIQEPAPKTAAPAGPPPKPAPDPGGQADFEADILVLGAGPGGYTAAFRAADLGQNVVLVDARPTLGGVCLNVGCIPSKALLHVAKVVDDAKAMGSHGVSFGAPTFDPAAIRGWKDGVVKRLTGGLVSLAKQRKVKTVIGEGKFTSANTLRVETAEGARVVRFNKAIIAAGSEPAAPGFIPADPRVWDSTGALEINFIPKRMLVLGGGIIGLEMATVYHSLGAGITVIEMMDQLMPGADPDIVAPLAKRIGRLYEKILLKTKVTASGRSRTGSRSATKARTARRPRHSTRSLFPSDGVRTARASERPLQESPSTSAAISPSTGRCAPTCRISSPSATSWASPCWRIRQRMKPRSRRRSPADTNPRLTPRRYPRLLTPIRKSPGRASPRPKPRPKASNTARPFSPGQRAEGLSPWS